MDIKRMVQYILLPLAMMLALSFGAFAAGDEDVSSPDGAFDLEGQLDALGKDELMDEVPQPARELLEDSGAYELSAESLLTLSPRDFFSTLWQLAVREAKKPLRTLGVIMAVIILCAMLGGLKTAVTEGAMAQMFSTVAALCILTSVITPILDCIVETSAIIREAARFMLTFIPIFSAALAASGHPVTGAAYNMFLFSTCQVVAQVAARTLIPLMGIYLALCVVGALVPEIRIASAAKSVKSAVSWTLGLLVTVFVGLLSVQTMVSGGADGVTSRAARFFIGSFVPVVGGALSEAFSAAQGCLRLIKATVGAYGIIVALFTFLPVLIQTALWYGVTGVAAMAGDVLGVDKVGEVMRGCSAVLGILMAIISCFGLLVIVSTAVVMVTSGSTV